MASTDLQGAPQPSKARIHAFLRRPSCFCGPSTIVNICSRQNGCEARSKPLSGALGVSHVISTAVHTKNIDQDKIPNRISSGCTVLSPKNIQFQCYIVDDEQQTPSWNSPDMNYTERYRQRGKQLMKEVHHRNMVAIIS